MTSELLQSLKNHIKLDIVDEPDITPDLIRSYLDDYRMLKKYCSLSDNDLRIILKELESEMKIILGVKLKILLCLPSKI